MVNRSTCLLQETRTCIRSPHTVTAGTRPCPVSEMTYTVSSGTLNSSIPYHSSFRPHVNHRTAKLTPSRCCMECHGSATDSTVVAKFMDQNDLTSARNGGRACPSQRDARRLQQLPQTADSRNQR